MRLYELLESLDKDQKRAGQVAGEEKARKIGPVLGKAPKQHPYKGRLVGENVEEGKFSFTNSAAERAKQREQGLRSPLRNSAELAAMLKIDRYTLSSLINKFPGFPKPVSGVRATYGSHNYYQVNDFKKWVRDNNVLDYLKQRKSIEQESIDLSEVAPPGMEDWIKDRKADFKERYGKRWKEVLYATAWKRKNAGK